MLEKWAKQLIENDGAGAVYHAGRAIEARDELRVILYYDECPRCRRVLHRGETCTCIAAVSKVDSP